MENEIAKLEGRTPTNIEQREDEIIFRFSDGSQATFYHEQDCCESVVVEDVNGSWADLLGVPLLVADERTSQGSSDWGTATWTFYTFRSINGSVDVRWHGESNGYYSERVDLRITEANREEE